MVLGVLEISTWQGLSIGAIHYYGGLWIQDLQNSDPNRMDTHIELTRKLTAKEIKSENLEAGFTRTRRGDTTEGFMTREDVMKAGLQYFKSNYKGILYEGQYGCVSAWQNLVLWPLHLEKTAVKMNALAKRFQALNGYEGKERARVERLDKKWYTLYSSLKIACKL